MCIHAKAMHCNPIPVLQTGIMFVVLRGGLGLRGGGTKITLCTHVLRDHSWAAPSAAKTQRASSLKHGICRLQYVEVYTTTAQFLWGDAHY